MSEREKKARNKKILQTIGCLFLLSLSVVVIIIGEKNFNEAVKHTPNENVVNLDIATDSEVTTEDPLYTGSIENIYFYNDDFTIIFKDGKYTMFNENNVCYFTGTYELLKGEDGLGQLSQFQLLCCGLNSKKINIDNFYYIKLNFEQHGFSDNVEFYLSDIHNFDKNYFELLFYAKQTESGFMGGICPINELSEINFENSYF